MTSGEGKTVGEGPRPKEEGVQKERICDHDIEKAGREKERAQRKEPVWFLRIIGVFVIAREEKEEEEEEREAVKLFGATGRLLLYSRWWSGEGGCTAKGCRTNHSPTFPQSSHQLQHKLGLEILRDDLHTRTKTGDRIKYPRALFGCAIRAVAHFFPQIRR